MVKEIEDQPNLPEKKLHFQLWNGSTTHPITSQPMIGTSDGKVYHSGSTEGASIEYKEINENGNQSKVWAIYRNPKVLSISKKLLVQAYRIGYEASEIVEVDIADFQ